MLYLCPPRFSFDCIKEKIICIRGHRERLFRIELEQLNGALICHNYGQGGAGWTFLFGAVQQSIHQYEQYVQLNPIFRNKPIAVIGAGCYGLLTALLLARKGYSVRIVAEHTDDLTSDKAAGFFFPRPRKSSTVHERALFEAIGIESYKTYQAIAQGRHPFIQRGAELLPAYYGLTIDPGYLPYRTHGLVADPRKVTISFGQTKQYEVMQYTTIFMQVTVLMQELRRLVQELGIALENKRIKAFEEVPESIVFNCAGLGAKELTNDSRIVPVQGHLITLQQQPALDQLRYLLNVQVTMRNHKGMLRDELIYYAPKESGIIGITFLRGQNSVDSNHHEFDRLLERCGEFFGS